MMIKPALTILFLLATWGNSPDKPAYLLYNQSGGVISYQSVAVQAGNSDLIFFGELHNSAIAHWLQLELLSDLAADTAKTTMVGMEMFEADQQVLLDEYLAGLITQRSFESEARLWNNYPTDYKPVVEFARANGLPVIATNIPRRYANAVYSGGLDPLHELADEAKQWMMPLPVEVDTTLPTYRAMSEAAHGHGGVNLIYAQAVKDATMAHFILQYLKPQSRLLHLNGSYHSNQDEGIVWYVRQQRPDLRILTINTITVADVRNVDPSLLQAADITVVVPETMTTTH
ncbi:MAG: ChaN family lipoprotein [Balneolaceae bacterium]